MPWNLQYCLRNFWEEVGGREGRGWGVGGGGGDWQAQRPESCRFGLGQRWPLRSGGRQVGGFWDQGGLGSSAI